MNLDDLDDLHREVMSCTASGREHVFAYLFANTRSNARSLYETAARLSGLVGVIDAPTFIGYDGFDAWHHDLEERGVDPGRILHVPFDATSHNTLTEATAVVRFAKKEGLRRMLVVAPRFHLLRAFMTTVGALGREGVDDLHVHPVPGTDLTWDEVAVHSQGILTAPRSDLVFYEATRIMRYYDKGDLPEPRAVLEHLRRGGTQ